MDLRYLVRVLLVGLFCITLSSCQIIVPIAIQQLDDGRISIETKNGIFRRSCIEFLTIFRVVQGKTESNFPMSWRISTMAGNDHWKRCVSKVTYPKVPADYQKDVPGEDLRPGQKYIIEAEGPGYDTKEEMVRRVF